MAIEKSDPEELAERLGISIQAVDLARSSGIIDLHLDTFIPVRLWGYDIRTRHGLGFFRGRFFGHLDLPRAIDAGLSGGMWSITTNPFRAASGRWRVFQKNLGKIQSEIAKAEGDVRIVRTSPELEAALADGVHACMLSVQGGNCFEGAPGGVADVQDRMITRVTIVHLTNSVFGTSSSPVCHLRRNKGLSNEGREFIEQLNAERVFVDLAHIHPASFWDAVEVHDKSQPILATHTGVDGVKPHWRNLDDDQLQVIADSGGTVGIIYSQAFLKSSNGPRDGGMVVDHMDHIISVVGEDHVSIGTDYDGAIVPPPDFRSGDSYPRLVQHMLDRGYGDERIEKILSGNIRRAFRSLRPS